MNKSLTLACAFWISFLPPHFRRRAALEETAELRTATILSGIVQALLCALLYIGLFFDRVPWSFGAAERAIAGTDASLDPTVYRLGTNVLGLANFALQPLPIVLGYLAFEGLFRSVAALAVSQNLGTLPLYLADWLRRGLADARYRSALGPAVMDRILPASDSTYDLRVLSCRPKPEWNPYVTVRFRDEFYVLIGEEAGDKPRPFVYRLRRSPAGRLVVVVRDYRPDDPIRKPPYNGL